MAEAGQKTFVRKASGLVREVSGVDVLIFNVFMISIGYILFIVLFWTAYPGASLELSIAVASIVAIFQGLTYALLASAYPRSGGDYVYVTRILHPTLGFVMSWDFFVWELFYLGLNAAMVGFQGLAPLLAGAGFVANDANLISMSQWAGGPTSSFLIATVAILFYAGLLASGMKNYFKFQKVLFVVAIASTAVVVALLAATSHQAFVTRFNDLAQQYSGSGDTYHQIIQTATANGYLTNAPFSLLETVAFFVWPWLAVGFCVLSGSFSGEVKNVKRSQIFGIVGSVIVTGVLFALLTFLGGHVFGYDFLGAASYLLFNNPDLLPIPVAPWYSLFTALLTDNAIVNYFILVGWFCWFLLLAATVFVFVSRTAFAWAMDGLLPDAFKYVNEKYRTPINTILLSGVGGVLFAAGIEFTTWLGVLSGALGIAWAFFFTSVAAVVFPFRRRDFYKRSGIAWEISGVPVISIVGGANVVALLAAIYIMIVDPRAGANSFPSLTLVLLFLLAGVVLFYAMKYVRKKQGVDVNLIFREIPVE